MSDRLQDPPPIGPDLRQHIRDHPVDGPPDAMRRAFARLAGPQRRLDRIEVDGIPCAVAGHGTPKAIWLHGGGYVFGGAESHSNTIHDLAQRLGHAVLMPLYRKAPEAHWPAPLDDALRVLDAFRDPVAIVGDSAGGHLALHVAFQRPEAVRSLALIGANTDRTGKSRTRRANGEADLMNDDATDAALAQMALPGVAPDSVDASPLLGPLDRLPPVFLTCAANEVLADDTLLLARATALAGGDVTLHVERDLFHMWTLWPTQLPQAAQTLGRLADWIRLKG